MNTNAIHCLIPIHDKCHPIPGIGAGPQRDPGAWRPTISRCARIRRASHHSTDMSHSLLVTLHLFAAILFVGTVFFEVLILEGIRKPLGREAMRNVELAIGRRARRIMPFAMIVLFGAGLGMAWQFRESLAHPFASSFATLLWIKIILAFSVLGHFITAMTLSGTGKLKSRHFQLIHISVFCHVVLIVFLAKAMFYLTW